MRTARRIPKAQAHRGDGRLYAVPRPRGRADRTARPHARLRPVRRRYRQRERVQRGGDRVILPERGGRAPGDGRRERGIALGAARGGARDRAPQKRPGAAAGYRRQPLRPQALRHSARDGVAGISRDVGRAPGSDRGRGRTRARRGISVRFMSPRRRGRDGREPLPARLCAAEAAGRPRAAGLHGGGGLYPPRGGEGRGRPPGGGDRREAPRRDRPGRAGADAPTVVACL